MVPLSVLVIDFNLRRLLSAPAIVALSQLGSAGYTHAALAAGADLFVDKDRMQVDLVPAILQIAGAEQPAPISH
jgi:DNA-binding NarL/FixJ family response regulator